GGGRLPSVAPVEWVQVSSEEPVSLALARLAQIRTSARPGTFAEWQRQASARGAHLVVLDQLRAAVQYGEREQWRIFVEQLERDWMAPLLSALRTQELAALTLYLGGGAYRLTAAQTRRWWRRRRPLSAYR